MHLASCRIVFGAGFTCDGVSTLLLAVLSSLESPALLKVPGSCMSQTNDILLDTAGDRQAGVRTSSGKSKAQPGRQSWLPRLKPGAGGGKKVEDDVKSPNADGRAWPGNVLSGTEWATLGCAAVKRAYDDGSAQSDGTETRCAL